MRAAKFLSFFLGLLVLYMLACPLVEAATRSYFGHDSHGEQNQMGVRCCKDEVIPVAKYQVDSEHPLGCVDHHAGPAIEMAVVFPLLHPASHLYLGNSDHLPLLSVLRI
jgi:hypothetical protein